MVLLNSIKKVNKIAILEAGNVKGTLGKAFSLVYLILKMKNKKLVN